MPLGDADAISWELRRYPPVPGCRMDRQDTGLALMLISRPMSSSLARSFSGPLRVWILALLFSVPGVWLLLHGEYSTLAFLIIAAGFLISWVFNKAGTIVLMFLFLFLLGDVRRIINTFAGFPHLDPMLLVGPLFAIYVALPLVLSVRLKDPLSKSVLGLTVMMSLAVFNPRQGSLLVGLSGALFFLVPMCWFWIARRYSTDRLLFLLLYRVVVPLGVTAAVLGIAQTYIGFLPWERAWVNHALESGNSALYLGAGHIRSFGFSVNGVEYSTLLMLSSVCVIAAFMAGRRAYALLLPVLLTAQVLAASRTPFLKLVFAAVVIWAVRGKNMRSWLPRIALGVVVGTAALIYSAREAANTAAPAKDQTTTSADLATTHVAEGLAHPLDKRYSTAGAHSFYFMNGITLGFKNPIGFGLGIVTLGAGKFGADTSVAGATEVDISDVFVTLGFVGGFVYLFVLGAGLWAAAKFVKSGSQLLGYTLIGVLTCMLGGWIPLGQYATGPAIWFCLGYLAKFLERSSESRRVSNPARRQSELLELAPQ